jgi:7-carboxy-7-deazaguanine synthase
MIHPKIIHTEIHYPVMETLFTLFKEREFHTGKTPPIFIRLAGCDVGCSWCDVKRKLEK